MGASEVFVTPTEGDWVTLAPGLRRRLLARHNKLMMVEVEFEAGVVGETHSHPHIQVTYVAAGRFEVTIGERKTILAAGDSFMVPAEVAHGCVALEAGTLIDAFSPAREDFL